MKRKYPKLKAHSLGAAFFGDDEELDLGDIELDPDDVEEDDENEEEDESDEDSEDEDSEEADEEEDAPKQSRAQERIRRLAKEKKDAIAENIKLRNQVDQFTSQRQQPSQDDQRAYQAFLASLTPEQRNQHELKQELLQHRQSMALVQFQLHDTSDKSAYDTKAISNKLYAKYAPAVEKRLAELRRDQNLNAPREEVLAHLIGKAMLKIKNGTATTKKKAAASVAKNKVKPGSGKSDVKGGQRKGNTAKERLANVRF